MTDQQPVECVIQLSTTGPTGRWQTVITGTWETPLTLDRARSVVRGLRADLHDGDWRVLERGQDGVWRTREEATALHRTAGPRPSVFEWGDTAVPSP